MSPITEQYDVELSSEWKLRLNMENNCSALLTPTGRVVCYRYRQMTKDEAYAMRDGYIEGHLHGNMEQKAKIAKIFDL